MRSPCLCSAAQRTDQDASLSDSSTTPIIQSDAVSDFSAGGVKILASSSGSNSGQPALSSVRSRCPLHWRQNCHFDPKRHSTAARRPPACCRLSLQSDGALLLSAGRTTNGRLLQASQTESWAARRTGQSLGPPPSHRALLSTTFSLASTLRRIWLLACLPLSSSQPLCSPLPIIFAASSRFFHGNHGARQWSCGQTCEARHSTPQQAHCPRPAAQLPSASRETAALCPGSDFVLGERPEGRPTGAGEGGPPRAERTSGAAERALERARPNPGKQARRRSTLSCSCAGRGQNRENRSWPSSRGGRKRYDNIVYSGSRPHHLCLCRPASLPLRPSVRFYRCDCPSRASEDMLTKLNCSHAYGFVQSPRPSHRFPYPPSTSRAPVPRTRSHGPLRSGPRRSHSRPTSWHDEPAGFPSASPQ